MSDHRRRVSVLATGAVSLALLASPLAAVAQDDEAMAIGQRSLPGRQPR